MNDEALTLYSYEAAPMSVSKIPRSSNYQISVWNQTPVTLERGVDFGMIRKKNGDPMAKHPTLFKSGAEKVAVTYGLCQRYHLESRMEDIENGFFYFLVRCDLVKIVDGREYTITSSYGSANTREGRNGNQSPYDGANSAIKMAQKRALVSAALSLGCMSDSFTQDIESDTDDANVYYASKDPKAPIASQQIKFFYSAASRHGLTKNDAKQFLKDHGYASAKEIKSGDFDALLSDLDKEAM